MATHFVRSIRSSTSTTSNGVFKPLLLQCKQIRSYTPQATTLDNLNNVPHPKVTTLPSGVRVATADGYGDTVTVGVWIEAGSAHEVDAKVGTANFLQNVAMMGTSSRPQLGKELSSIGATLKGATEREKTSFVAQAHKSEVPKVVDILTDIVKNNTYSDADIEATRARIQKNQNATASKYEIIVLDNIFASAYQGSTYANSPLGEPASIKSINATDLVKFANKHYTSPNIILVGTGGIKHEELVSLASKSLDSQPSGIKRTYEPVDYVGSDIRIRDDTLHTLYSGVAFEAVGRSDPHYWTFLLLKTFLGSWSKKHGGSLYHSARLAERLAFQNLAYNYNTFYESYGNTGIFGVRTESSWETADDLIYYVFNEIQKLSTYINETELERAKNMLKGSLLAYLQCPINSANKLASDVMYNFRALPLPEIIQRIDNIEAKDIQNCISTYLTDVDPVLIAYGNLEEYPDYNIARNWTSWNRW